MSVAASLSFGLHEHPTHTYKALCTNSYVYSRTGERKRRIGHPEWLRTGRDWNQGSSLTDTKEKCRLLLYTIPHHTIDIQAYKYSQPPSQPARRTSVPHKSIDSTCMQDHLPRLTFHGTRSFKHLTYLSLASSSTIHRISTPLPIYAIPKKKKTQNGNTHRLPSSSFSAGHLIRT